SDRALGQVPRCQQLREPEPVGAADLEAPLHGDVPERHAVEQRVELRLEGVETDREVHVVIDGEALWPVPLCRLVVRRAAVSSTALDEAHVEWIGHRANSSRLRVAWIDLD